MKDLIKYRIERADNSIKEAEFLLNGNMSLESVMNRLYYAMFYAVLGLLEERGLGTSKHSHAISLFDKEFVKAGIFNKELSETFHKAFDLRQKGDYEKSSLITKDNIDEILPKAKHFVNEIKKYLLNN
jgi:uncharacterized protein (UPF0332 family)